MNFRFMRMIVFFDLPMLTDKNRLEYNHFRKFLIKNGFIMMQKSVYSKLIINNVASVLVRNLIASNLPSEGIIELLEITENQFSRIEYLLGKHKSAVIDSCDRIVEI